MERYIKLGSDRPDHVWQLTDVEDRPLDLTDATNVQLFMWDGSGNLLINDAAEFDAPVVGEVAYDFSRGQIVAAGTNHIEFRVDWSNGDKEFFPTDEKSFKLEVTEKAGDREQELAEPDAPKDAAVTRLYAHGAIEVTDVADLVIENGGVHIRQDLTVDGTVNVGNFTFGDDDTLTFGLDDDFALLYDSTLDAWKIRHTDGVDALRTHPSGDVVIPSGDLTDGNVTIYDAVEEHVPLSTLEASSISVNGYSTSLGGSVSLAHADLDAVSEDDHHSPYTDDDAEAAVAPLVSAPLYYDSSTPEIYLSTNEIGHGDLDQSSIGAADHHEPFTSSDAISSVEQAGSLGLTGDLDTTATLSEQTDRVATRNWVQENVGTSGYSDTDAVTAVEAEDPLDLAGALNVGGAATIGNDLDVSGQAFEQSDRLATRTWVNSNVATYSDTDAINAIESTDPLQPSGAVEAGGVLQSAVSLNAPGSSLGEGTTAGHAAVSVDSNVRGDGWEIVTHNDGTGHTQVFHIDHSGNVSVAGDITANGEAVQTGDAQRTHYVSDTEPSGWDDGDLWFEPES